MRGSIRKRGSTYTYWLDIGPDPVTGKRRQCTKGGFRTKRECQAALNDAIAAVQGGTFVEPSRRTMRSMATETSGMGEGVNLLLSGGVGGGT